MKISSACWRIWRARAAVCPSPKFDSFPFPNPPWARWSGANWCASKKCLPIVTRPRQLRSLARSTLLLRTGRSDAERCATGNDAADRRQRSRRKFQPFLLHGVTGSGKTAVYIAAMRRALDAGLSSLLLVPEIGLTPAMLAQLRFTFGDQVALLHSALTGAERTAQWHRIRRGEAHVVVGTRSAVFAPIADLALIVIDEEHDTSYKQAELPRYHARDVAVMRAKLAGATVVLGSATPSLESWANAQRGKYSLLSLKQRVGNRPLPEVSLIDMRQEFAETGQEALLSRAMTEEIEATLARGEQAMLLLNRRGYSFVVMCRACGEKLECDNCAIALTHHKSSAEDETRSPVASAHGMPLLRLSSHRSETLPEV